MQSSSRSVTYAKLHVDAFIPGVGSLGTTLPAPNKTVSLRMRYADQGLYVTANNREVLFPPGSVALVVFEQEGARAAELSVVSTPAA